MEGATHVQSTEITLNLYLLLENAVKGKNYVYLTQPKKKFKPKLFQTH